MARIVSFDHGTQSVSRHPTEVDCFWQIIEERGGEKLIHLTTFGSDRRASKPKSSQSLQLDGSMAQELIDLLRASFPAIH